MHFGIEMNTVQYIPETAVGVDIGYLAKIGCSCDQEHFEVPCM